MSVNGYKKNLKTIKRKVFILVEVVMKEGDAVPIVFDGKNEILTLKEISEFLRHQHK